jgi:hypothetical protein
MGLALWDIIVALQVLKKFAPTFLETSMHKLAIGLFSDDVQCVYQYLVSYKNGHDVQG